MISDKVTDAIAAGGCVGGSVGIGVGIWMTHNWLAILSAVAIVLTVFFKYRQDKRQRRRLELLENDEND